MIYKKMYTFFLFSLKKNSTRNQPPPLGDLLLDMHEAHKEVHRKCALMKTVCTDNITEVSFT